MSDDQTPQCLADVQDKFPEFQLADLRNTFCSVCRNGECGHAMLAGNTWEQRMMTQEDRLLLHPTFADLQDPRWAHIRELDFPSMFREAIRAQLADHQGDWSIPTTKEVDAAMGKLGLNEKPSDPIVERAVQNMERLQTVITIPSRTQEGVEYAVTLDSEGQAIACTCVAGKHSRRCVHRIWAEQEWQQRKGMLVEKRAEVVEDEDAEESLAMLGVRVQALREPLPELAKNAPAQSMLLDEEGPQVVPVDGLRKVLRDPWDATKKTTISPSGICITLGKKKDE
jgi:hypothetical protein